ncbi:MAG TPA: reverse transcriptase N-terminal domain-containing protein [Propionibacteriaceae bacterium]
MKTADAAQAVTPAIAAANGPEDEITDWLSIDWQQVEDDVRRLRQRIFTATQAGDLAKARNLQKLMLRSRANALLSVRRVTEVNAGRETAGIDGKTALLPHSKAELADWEEGPRGTDRRAERDRPSRPRPPAPLGSTQLTASTLRRRLRPVKHRYVPGDALSDLSVASWGAFLSKEKAAWA